MSLERETNVLAQAVGDEIEVARAGPDTLGLCALDVVLEPIEAAPDPSRPGEPEQVLGRLDEDGHLVAVVLAAVMETVHGRSDRGAEDRSPFHQLARVHPDPPFRCRSSAPAWRSATVSRAPERSRTSTRGVEARCSFH